MRAALEKERLAAVGLLAWGVLQGCSPQTTSHETGTTSSREIVPTTQWRLTPHTPDLPPARLAGMMGLFAPIPDVPDYQMSWRKQITGPLRSVTSIIQRHGNWIRSDQMDSDVKSVQHVHVPTGVTVTDAVSVDESRRSFSIQAPERERSSSGTIYQSTITELGREFAGERCRWWSVYHGLSDGEPSYRHQSCVTDDGIEIGSRTLGSDGEVWSHSLASATDVIRKPVPANVAMPEEIPVGSWHGQFFGQFDRSSERNFSVVLSGYDREIIVRRRGAWTGELTRQRDGSLTAYASMPGGYVSVRIGAGGKPESLTYDRHPAHATRSEVMVDEPDETILGMRCRWIDVMPYVMDAGRHECRSESGIPLKVRLFARGARSEFVAVQIDQSTGSIEDVLPPPELLDVKTWGAR